jgi:predicted O-linked N-acetylglucosamine transferase (SPINDLY family)
MEINRMDSTICVPDWGKEAFSALNTKDYSKVVELYEEKVDSSCCTFSDSCYLGLAYLLNGQEDLAQIIWFNSISENEPDTSVAVQTLQNILEQEAQRQSDNGDFKVSWIIRQHIKEITPSNIFNLIELVILSDKLETLSVDLLKELNILEALKLNSGDITLEPEKLESLLTSILDLPTREALAIADELSSFTCDKKMYCNLLLKSAQEAKHKSLEFAAEIVKLCLRFFPENLVVLRSIYLFYSTTEFYKEVIHWSNRFYKAAQGTEWELMAIYSLIREKTRGGEWFDLEPVISDYKNLMEQFQASHKVCPEKDLDVSLALPIMPIMLQYYQDDISENRNLQNRVGMAFQEEINRVFIDGESRGSLKPRVLRGFSYLHKRKIFKRRSKIKIGFLVSKLKTHSVGWLARWLFKYYDQERFEFFTYVTKQEPGDFFAYRWYESKVEKCTYYRAEEYLNVVEDIYSDDIDILIDLDSTTSCESCVVMALKPAPVQATWLGFDASGVPAIDYFIVDPYLLPEDAQHHYSEKLWRLPRTYLAVDGFEVEVPTISRQDLNIPNDAVVFLSAQTGQKRNPNTVRLQLQILKATPNSYLIVKGWGDNITIQELFLQLSRDEDITPDRLRFLKPDENEFIHRANLQIADVILDTYPYNGATTTLEALWMGVPIVTRMGQQCAARNSYTFLKQVGVTDGIATTDEEYVQWGIRFGNEPGLRQKANAQLRQSRHTSSVWDTKQFVRDMEDAWIEMWEIYQQNN